MEDAVCHVTKHSKAFAYLVNCSLKVPHVT